MLAMLACFLYMVVVMCKVQIACCSYTLVGLFALTPLFPWPGACPVCGRLPPPTAEDCVQ
jgi:hypothetical protein